MTRRSVLLVPAIFSLHACASLQPAGTPIAPPGAGSPRLFDASSIYRSMGALVGGGALPFVASVRYVAGATPDSTLALFSASLTNQTLTFQRRGTEFVAEYHVEASFRTESTSVTPLRQIASDEQVRVRNFQETLRADESVIYQQIVTLPPGVYYVTAMVRDRNSPAFSRAERVDTVPLFGPTGMSEPIAVYSADGRQERSTAPKLLTNPRATLPYGPDSMRFYVERYGAPPAATAVTARVVDAGNHELWRDSVPLIGGGARGGEGHDVAWGTVVVVPSKLPVGSAELQTLTNGGDTTRAPFLVSFSNQWVITNFDEMMSLLRYFDRQDWVDSLRRSTADRRPDIWRDLWKATDPVPLTPENEALDDYFRRVQQANLRFPDEGGPGWLTERGEVFISLGEPDDIADLSNNIDRSGGRIQRWTYSTERLVLYFQDPTGFSRFRLTPSSRADFQRAVMRVRQSRR